MNGLRKGSWRECGEGSLHWKRGRQQQRPASRACWPRPPRRLAPRPSRLPCCLPPRERARSSSIAASSACPTRTPLSPAETCSCRQSPSTRPAVYSEAHGHGPGVPAAPCPPRCVSPALPLSAEASVFSVKLEEIKRGLPESPPTSSLFIWIWAHASDRLSADRG